MPSQRQTSRKAFLPHPALPHPQHPLQARNQCICAAKRLSRPRPPRPPKITRPRPTTPPPDPRQDRWAAENLGFLHIATIIGAHGVRGEAKAVSEGHFSVSRLGPGVHLHDRYLLLPGRRYPRPVLISAGRKASQKNTWILRLEGIDSREDVIRFRGARLYVKEGDRPKLARDEFMVADLVGSRVRCVGDDTVIGVVDSVITKDDLCTAAGSGAAAASVAADLLEIAIFPVKEDPCNESVGYPDRSNTSFKGDIPEKAKRVLVPFVKQVVPFVDKKNSIINIDPPEGLLDIAVVNRKEKPRPPRGLLMAAKE